MGRDREATTGCTGAVGVVGLIGCCVDAHMRRLGRSRRLRRRVFISSAGFAVAVLPGCGTGYPEGESTAPTASTAASLAQASSTRAATGPAPLPAGTGTTRVCITSIAKGSCGPYDYRANTACKGWNTYVGQDVWNPIPGWQQTLTAADPGHWHVTASMRSGNTAVVSYPSSSQASSGDSTNPALSNYTMPSSTFAEGMHATAGTDAEAVYDIWLNKWGDEVMLQHGFSSLRPRCETTLARLHSPSRALAPGRIGTTAGTTLRRSGSSPTRPAA